METYDSGALPDLLPLYYRRLFPFPQYYRWLSYGGVTKNYFQNREFSFTLKDDIYVRYQSFNNQSELEKEMQKMNPYKIDIGAVYSHRPSQHTTVKSGAFQAQEKELVFDIDMTDYDDVRSCCSSADICPKCWTLMTIAIQILDRALEEDFGFEHRLWVYSGRRGVHCWVCDEAARKLSQAARSTVAEYLSLVKGGQEAVKKVQLSDTLHPFISESIKVVQKYFEKYALQDQDILGSKETWVKVLALLPEEVLLLPMEVLPQLNTTLLWELFMNPALEKRLSMKRTILREDLERDFRKAQNSCQRWEQVKKAISKPKVDLKKGANAHLEVMLQYCYPRLDVNVSKGVNHLLKSPFSVHPKTGRISVPIDVTKLDQFDPFVVPTISQICSELDTMNQKDEDDNEEEMVVEDAASEAEPELKRRKRDYKRTSLAPYVKVFERFLEKLEQSRKGELLRKSDLDKDF